MNLGLLGNDDRLRPVLVVDAQARLEEVEKGPWPTSWIIAATSTAQAHGWSASHRRRSGRGVEGLLGQVDDAQAVGEPVVIGSGIGQVADAKPDGCGGGAGFRGCRAGRAATGPASGRC